MTPFLKHTAEFLIHGFGSRMDTLCVVLPNRRAGLFLRKYLAEMAGKPTWSPIILSVEDFLGQISGLQEADSLTLLFELYTVHCEVAGNEAVSFDDFIQWAPQLISDFDEIDRYQADARELFESLTEARAISLWNPDGRPLTSFEQKYLRFYRSLYPYHERFTENLKAAGLGYTGLIFREAAEKIQGGTGRLPWHHVVFAGFNALTKAEETIIDVLREQGLATLLWDADRYYLEDKRHEAGEFLRRWLNRWPVREPRWISDGLISDPKTITIIGSPDPLGQTRYCSSLLKEMALEGMADERTAVVLPDEGMLFPLLNSIPPEITALNITAGLSLRQTPLASLFDLIFRMQTGSGRFNYLSGRGAGRFYYADMLKVLTHPYLQLMAGKLAGGNRFAYDDIVADIRSANRVFAGLADLKKESLGVFASGLDFLDPVFTRWNDTVSAMTALRAIIGFIRQAILLSHNPSGEKTLDANAVDLEYLYIFSTIINRLENQLSKYPGTFSIQSLHQLFTQVADSTSVPFSGEPLTGIQIMGMLETRTVDFENIIILSFNDDRIPGGKPAGSFIPFDIKRAFDLPGYRQRDAVAAYHFYRLLQRAKRIWIFYITEPDRMGGGDRSRFLRQLTMEMPLRNPQVKISSSVLTTPPPKGELPPVISIGKTDDVLMKLLNRATKGYSATSLNAYRNCRLKFYYSEIAGLREPDDTEETIGPALLGTAIHEALFTLFKPFTDQPMTTGILEGLMQIADEAVDKAFEKKYHGGDVTFGRNLLLVNVAKILVKRYFTATIANLKTTGKESGFSVAMLEQYVEQTLVIQQGTENITVKIKGLIDRVDRMQGWWKIIDYKTGQVTRKQLNVTSWEALMSDSALNIGFQLMLYAWLLKGRLSESAAIGAGIVSLRRINDGFLPLVVSDDENDAGSQYLNRTTLGNFQGKLKELLEEIHNPVLPFDQTDDYSVCRNCPFINLCCR